MSDFAKENLNSCDYDSLNVIWERQLIQLGYHRVWGENGPGWCAPDTNDSVPQSLYDAWASATDTPTDLKLGIEKEPPVAPYRKPV
jgi:hypothetical protein